MGHSASRLACSIIYLVYAKRVRRDRGSLAVRPRRLLFVLGHNVRQRLVLQTREHVVEHHHHHLVPAVPRSGASAFLLRALSDKLGHLDAARAGQRGMDELPEAGDEYDDDSLGAHVRQERHARVLEQLGVDVRLGRVHVEPDAVQLAGRDGVQQRVLVYQPAAGGSAFGHVWAKKMGGGRDWDEGL